MTFSVCVGGLVAVLGVSGLGCVAFSVPVLGPVSPPLGVSDLSLRHAAGEGFLLGFRLVTSARCGGGFLARFEPGFRWCLAVLSPSPGGAQLRGRRHGR